MQSSLEHLRALPIWVPVKIVPKHGKPGKTDKIPCNVEGYQIDAQNPANCMSWYEADVLRQALPAPAGGAMGVGLVIREPPPGQPGLFCVDLDDCITPGGGLTDLALGFIEVLPGVLMERSYSGRGLHLWGYGELPADHRVRSAAVPGLEVYTRGRFILVTDDFVGGWMADHGPALSVMVEAFFGAPPVETSFDWSDEGAFDDVPDERIVEQVRAHRMHGPGSEGKTGRALWDGDADELAAHYPSSTGDAYDASGADLALATLLMRYTGNNAERSARLLSESGLARDKHSREDYMRWTMQRAWKELPAHVLVRPEQLAWAGAVAVPPAPCDTDGSVEGVREASVASASSAAKPAPSAAPWSVPRWPPGAFLSESEMAEHFRGCVYVVSRDEIYCPDGQFLGERQFNAKFSGQGVMFKMTPDNKMSKKAWDAYHNSEAFTAIKVDRSTFNPSESPSAILDGAVNTWVPPDVPMTAGDASPYLDLLQRQIPDERDRRIFLSWMAAAVQHSDVKFRWSPYIQGCKGNGKTTHLTVMEYCIGTDYTCRPAADKMGKQFNAIYDRKLMVCVDDINMAGHNALWDKLKPMITEDVMEIEVKGVDSSCVRDMRNKYMFTSNEQAGLPVTSDERRLAPFFTAQQEPEDLARDGMAGDYFVKLHKWLGSGPGGHKRGLAIVAHFLMHYPIDPEFNPAGDCQRAPVTTSTQTAIDKSRTGIERHVQDAIELTGELGADGSVTHLQIQMFYRKHGARMPDVKECSDLLREFGFRWDRKVTWRRAASVPPAPVVVPAAPVS